MKCTQEKCPIKDAIGTVKRCTMHNCSYRTYPSVIGRRVSAGEGEYKKYGTVVAVDTTTLDIYGAYPIEVLWEDGTLTQTTSFWVDWSKEG